MMNSNEKTKIKVIDIIDRLRPRFTHTVYFSELKMMRLKYIYKDISSNELKKDLTYLKNLSDISKLKKVGSL